MGSDLNFFQIPFEFFKHLDKGFTFLLLVTRFAAMFSILPGLQGGVRGLAIRAPFFFAVSIASLATTKSVPLPADPVFMAAAFFSEALLGLALGMIPLIIVATAQNAGQLSSISMGLQTNAQIDPSTGGQTADLARLFGDLTTLSFLALNGHHVMIYAASGLSGRIVPGSFVLEETTINLLIERSVDIFATGMLLAAPVIVALLLTQFVMGYVSKLVPQVNVFIVSFPITVGIGLILAMLCLPEVVRAVGDKFGGLEGWASVVLQSAKTF